VSADGQGDALELVLGKLDGVRQQSGYWMARCPAHEDGEASLSIARGTEQPVVLNCHAGCVADDILASIGLTTASISKPREKSPRNVSRPKRRAVAEYHYTDENGEVLFTKVRYQPKGFSQYRMVNGRREDKLGDVRRVLYRLPKVIEAVKNGEPVFVAEGEKDVHALEAAGVTATCNFDGAAKDTQRQKWRQEYNSCLAGADVVVIADRDDSGRAHASHIAASLASAAKSVRIVEAAEGKDAHDHLAAGHSVDDLVPFTPPDIPGEVQAEPDVPPPPFTPSDIPGELLRQVHGTYKRWLGSGYDIQVLDAVLSATAAGKLGGDPAWLLVVGGSGRAKTETVSPLAGSGATVVSTITGEAALLSSTSKRERAANATGGLLREIGDSGTLVVKDFTSILSMNRDTRVSVLGALREIYDGYWTRNVGTDGGQTLRWKGRIVLIGAVTTAWDSAHQVVATMGDRFVLARLESGTASGERRAAGRQAMRNVDSEVQMRRELAGAAAVLLASVNPDAPPTLTENEEDELLDLADIVTRARTSVERDFQGNPAWAHALEMPTRFAKQLVQIARGGIAIGMDRGDALEVAARCARDSMPPVRQKILADVAEHPDTPTAEVVTRLQLPRQTVDRTLQELQLLGLLTVDGIPYGDSGRTRWIYSLAPDVDPAALAKFTRNVSRGKDRAA
jgi:hypothetical protein